jgi:hypothetical protein
MFDQDQQWLFNFNNGPKVVSSGTTVYVYSLFSFTPSLPLYRVLWIGTYAKAIGTSARKSWGTWIDLTRLFKAVGKIVCCSYYYLYHICPSIVAELYFVPRILFYESLPFM